MSTDTDLIDAAREALLTLQEVRFSGHVRHFANAECPACREQLAWLSKAQAARERLEKALSSPIELQEEAPSTWADPKTGLEWLTPASPPFPWREAMAWCEALGHGWRAPTIEELVTLVDYSAVTPAIVEPLRIHTTASDFHWSSSTYANFPAFAWTVNFFDGNVFADNKSYVFRVRAVREAS